MSGTLFIHYFTPGYKRTVCMSFCLPACLSYVRNLAPTFTPVMFAWLWPLCPGVELVWARLLSHHNMAPRINMGSWHARAKLLYLPSGITESAGEIWNWPLLLLLQYRTKSFLCLHKMYSLLLNIQNVNLHSSTCFGKIIYSNVLCSFVEF